MWSAMGFNIFLRIAPKFQAYPNTGYRGDFQEEPPLNRSVRLETVQWASGKLNRRIQKIK